MTAFQFSQEPEEGSLVVSILPPAPSPRRCCPALPLRFLSAKNCLAGSGLIRVGEGAGAEAVAVSGDGVGGFDVSGFRDRSDETLLERVVPRCCVFSEE